MKFLTVGYSHEFISNKITDELILYNIWNYKELEKRIISEVKKIFSFNIGASRNINTLSGGQRSITFLVTLTYILKERNIDSLELKLNNIIESLSAESSRKITDYLNKRGVNVT